MKFHESENEAALIALLQEAEWDYTHGSKLYRRNDELLLTEDLSGFLLSRHPELEPDDMTNIIDHLRHASEQTHFDRLRAGCSALGNLILLPPLEEQQSIVNLYHCIEEAKSIAWEACDRFTTLCPALIQYAINR